MNICLKEIIAHHTCEARGSSEEVLEKAPFKSEVRDEYFPFLGEGYYFWDNNLELAKKWGEKRYRNFYYVVEFILVIDENKILDLVGNREDILWLKKIKKQIEQRLNESFRYLKEKFNLNEMPDLTMGVIIELLKYIIPDFSEKIYAIKAIDLSRTYDKLYFRLDKEFLSLNPKIFYCFPLWKDEFAKSKKIIVN